MSYKLSISGHAFIQAHKAIAKDVGLIPAAVLGEMGFEESKYNADEFFHSQEEFVNTLCISMRQFKDAVNVLKKKGYITVTRKGVPCKNYYKINEDPIRIAIETYELSQNTVDQPVSTLCANKPEHSVPAIIKNINNNKNKNISSDEDIDSDESIKEQEAEVIEPTNTDISVYAIQNFSCIKKTDVKKYLTSDVSVIVSLDDMKKLNGIGIWITCTELKYDDIIELLNLEKSYTLLDKLLNSLKLDTDISGKLADIITEEKERKSSAGKKESKVKTPCQVVKGHYLELRNRLSASGIKFRNEIESTNGPLINQRLSHLMKDLKISVEDICLTFDYMSGEEYKVHQMDFSFVGCLREDIFLRSYNEMKSKHPKEPEYVPPRIRLTTGTCPECGERLHPNGTCPYCALKAFCK